MMASLVELVTTSSLMIILFVALQVDSAAQVGSPCSSSSDCKSQTTFLTCTRGACRCDSVSHFDSSQGTCLVHTAGSCDVTGTGRVGGRKCVQNAVCKAKSRGATIGSCECADGYEETTHGTCEIDNTSRNGAAAAGLSTTMTATLMATALAASCFSGLSMRL